MRVCVSVCTRVRVCVSMIYMLIHMCVCVICIFVYHKYVCEYWVSEFVFDHVF